MVKFILFFLLFFNNSLVFAQKDTGFTSYSQLIPGSTFTYNMVAIKGGNFLMGSAVSEKNRNPEEGPQKEINISPFWIGAYEITHDQFGIFFNNESLSQGSKVDAITRPTEQYIDLSFHMGKEGGFPMNSMSQDGALMFCRWLYQQTGIFYRLPTEAEWEYACRAGTTTAYFFGDDASQLDEYAWYKANSKNKYQKVGSKRPNPWGLYDMIGNVSEWTLDQYSDKYFDTVRNKDPAIAPSTRYPRSIRGGSYADDASLLRSASRQHSEPSWNKRDPQVPKSRWWLTDGMFVGFRILRPMFQPKKEDAESFYKLFLGK
jgi:formylglycine-generating enzyme required for sulfatase activity